MLCQKCGKKDAKIQMVMVENGRTTQINICEDCFAKDYQQQMKALGVMGAVPEQQKDVVDTVSAEQMLRGFMQMLVSGQAQAKGKEEPQAKLSAALEESRCPNCGTSLKDVMGGGFFGCPTCVDTWEDSIPLLLSQGSMEYRHTGKIPLVQEEGLLEKREIFSLQEEMRQYVEQEEYEKAAEIRDLLRAKEAVIG